jgi:DtxR family Mn-dependent transcriptional regulator
VIYEPYQGASLTAGGEKIALEVIRHHRLIELYLTEAMGFPWDRVHAEADRLEHAISDEFADRISTMLGDPKVDPHGDPIPSKDGAIAASSRQTLFLAPSGVQVRIERIRDEDPSLLRQVAELGLLPGTIVTVERPDVAGDAVMVTGVGQQAQLVGREISQSVFVVFLNAEG